MGLVLFASLVLAPATPGQEITDIRWGFDGRVVAEEFNLLTVFVSNPGQQPVDTDLLLSRTDGVARRGAALAQRVYLGPGATRIVQFQPFVVTADESWELAWRGLAGTVPAPAARAGAPALVWLADRPADGIGLPHFPTRLLPAAAVSLAALGGVVLDTAPEEWLAPQRQAFLEWLQSGGVLHLLPVEGRHPQFVGELAVLNRGGATFRIDQGLVVRHDFARARLTELPLPLVLTGVLSERGWWPANDGAGLVDALRTSLRARDGREIQTGSLLLIGLLYAGLAGPGLWWLSRRQVRWGVWIGSLGLLVAGTTYFFAWIGRGAVEDAGTRHTLIFAEQVAGDRYLVTTHMGLHVVRGAEYAFEGGAAHTLFTSAQTSESIRGEIRNGLAAKYDVDIPAYSRRMIIRRQAAAGPELSVSLSAGNVIDIDGPPDIESVFGIRGDEVLLFRAAAVSGRFVVVSRESVWRWIGSPVDGPNASIVEYALTRRTANQLGMADREPGSAVTRSAGDTLLFIACRGAPPAFLIEDVPLPLMSTTTIYSTHVHWR